VPVCVPLQAAPSAAHCIDFAAHCGHLPGPQFSAHTPCIIDFDAKMTQWFCISIQPEPCIPFKLADEQRAHRLSCLPWPLMTRKVLPHPLDESHSNIHTSFCSHHVAIIRLSPFIPLLIMLKKPLSQAQSVQAQHQSHAIYESSIHAISNQQWRRQPHLEPFQ
jgi:hypothetical protein